MVTQEEETFPTTVPIENPPERTSTILSLRTFIQLRTQFGFAENDVLFPGSNDTADNPPYGFVAVNRHMCLSGAIPPFNDFLRTLLLRLTISPFQLHPNGYAILMGLCVLFRRTLDRLPSFEEIRYLCSFTKSKDHPSLIIVRSARNRKLLSDLTESVHGFLNQFFFARCPPGFYAIWRIGSKTSVSIFSFLKLFPRSELSVANFILCSFQHFLSLLEIRFINKFSRG